MSNGKTVLITGASSGIGEALAERFADDRYELVLTARSVDKLQGLASRLTSQYGLVARVIPADLEAPDGAKALFDEVKRQNLTIDALVNNAGFGLQGAFAELDLEGQLRIMQLNMSALVALTKLFLSDLIASKGKLLNVASTAAFQPGPNMAIYCATKAFVLSFSEAIAEELADTGVTVTALCPGPTATGFADRAGAGEIMLFKVMTPMTSEAVAKIGYAGFKQGRRVVIAGALNWLMAQSIRFAPRRLATVIAKRVMSA